METILIQSKSKKHIKLLFDLATQLGDKPFIESKEKTQHNKLIPFSVDEFYKRNAQSQKEIKQGKLIDHKTVKAKFTSK